MNVRELIIAGNWKMHKGLDDSKKFSRELTGVLRSNDGAKVIPIIAPAYPFLAVLQREFENSPVKVAAQDVSVHDDGAFTGEVSASMLASLQLPYCIVGHSERRAYHAESNEIVREKAEKLMLQKIVPILCIGETLEQRDAGITAKVIKEQLTGCLHQINLYSGKELIIAYEPVWAIGTGRTASGAQAQEVHALIRKWLSVQYSEHLAESLCILYGGSVKPENIEELLNMPDIDGGLIGGAALKADAFVKMVEIAQKYDMEHNK
ncbi:MAG: triose-phosphate isomerase [Candidatus Cloacimonetes bacterium]|nr:triose-phosphate isomerase [Candidatus Cloacimonadota bacterium]